MGSPPLHTPARRSSMSSILPDAPSFETPVYGTVFGERARVVHRLREGDRLILVPDPPGVEQPSVWVHAMGGDVVGHLSPDVNRWLAPRMMEGARYGARVRSIGDPGTEIGRASSRERVVRPIGAGPIKKQHTTRCHRG